MGNTAFIRSLKLGASNPTLDVNWIAPRFSQQRTKALRAEASVADTDPMIALTTTSELLAAGGAGSLGRSVLRAYLANTQSESADFDALTRLVAAAILNS